MGSTFEKLKKNASVSAWIFAVGLGLSCGLFAVGLLSAIFKLTDTDFPLLYIALIGGAVALVVFSVLFFLARRNEKALAKILDEKHGLAERVQTMVDYKAENGEMVRLQRQDAEEKLKERTGGKWGFKKIICTGVSFVLALAMFITGLVLPGKEDAPPTPPPPTEEYEITFWQVDAMLSLMGYLEQSEMSVGMRSAVITDLSELLLELCSVSDAGEIDTLVTEQEAVLRVTESIVFVDGLAEAGSTHKQLYLLIYNSENSNVLAFASGLAKKDVAEQFGKIEESFENKTSNADASRADLSAFVSELQTGLSVTEVPQTDELLIQVLAFADSLKQLSENTAYNYVTLKSELEKEFTRAEDLINAPLFAQAKDREIADYVIAELIKIFEIKNPPDTGGDPLPPIAGSQMDEDKDSSGGPPNPDKPKYGSDDEIYYPFDQEYVEYGDVFKEYSAKKEEILREENADEALKDLIEKYFELLGGTAGQNPQN